jgi:uncharacterized protein with von Willebrand factor type A (vWA) domain
LTGWNPRDPFIKQNTIDLVNDEFWHGSFSRNVKTNRVIERLAREVISLRERNKENEEKTLFLLKLLEELSEYPSKTVYRTISGDEEKTYEALNDYIRYVIDTANKRLNIFEKIEP